MMAKHESDGTTYAGALKYKCRICHKRLSREEYHNGNCEEEDYE